MSADIKKRIYIARELFTAPIGSFFQNIGYELCDNFKNGVVNDDTLIVDDFLPKLDAPRIKSNFALNFDVSIEKNIRAVFDQSLLENPHVHALIHAQFSRGAEYEFIDRYSKQLKQVVMLKIQDYLNVGYFIDTMVIEAYKAQFNYDLIRNYLNNIMGYALAEIEKNREEQFVNVAYSFTENAFAVQLTFDKQEFVLEDEFAPGSDRLKWLTNNANYFDLNYFKKRSKLTLSFLWFKDESLKKFRSCFLNETAYRIVEQTTLNVRSGLEVQETVSYSPRDQTKKIALGRKVALFIKNYRKNEETPKENAKLEILDIEYYMTFYPRQAALRDVDDELKRFILKLLKDESFYDGITDYVKAIAESNLDDKTEEIQKILSGKSLSDLEETLIIHGEREDLADGFTRVKGKPEDEDDFTQVIDGVKENLSNNDKWEIKKDLINKKIEEEVTRIKADGKNVLQDDIIRVVSNHLDISDENVKIIVSGIVEEAVSKGMLVKGKSIEESIGQKIVFAKDGDPVSKSKLEEQNQKMKKLMELMKLEMVRLKEENARISIITPIGVEEIGDSLKLKAALAKTMSALKSKDKILETVKTNSEILLNEKNLKIEILEERMRMLKDDHAKSADHANLEKLTLLESENRNLISKLELSNKKINIISDNMESKEQNEIVKKDKELFTLKNSIQMAQVLIERFKVEKLDLESKLQSEKEISRKYHDEYEAKMKGDASADESIPEQEIQALMIEKRGMEEKNKLALNEIKKLEQKLKFATSQLESSLKKRMAPSNQQKSNEAYIKQLEVASQRLAEVNADLGERKKELLKFKQDNNVLSAKVAELEKKLSNLDKKAA